jgi:hypothetical protein
LAASAAWFEQDVMAKGHPARLRARAPM